MRSTRCSSGADAVAGAGEAGDGYTTTAGRRRGRDGNAAATGGLVRIRVYVPARRGSQPAEQVLPARIALPGAALELAHVGHGPRRQLAELRLHLGGARERVQAARPCLQLAGRLGSAVHELGEEGELGLVGAQLLLAAVLVADGATTDLLHVDDEAAVHERAERAFDLVGLDRHLRIAVALLVAAGDQGVQRQRIGLGDGLLLLDEHAEDAELETIEVEGHGDSSGAHPSVGRAAEP